MRVSYISAMQSAKPQSMNGINKDNKTQGYNESQSNIAFGCFKFLRPRFIDPAEQYLIKRSIDEMLVSPTASLEDFKLALRAAKKFHVELPSDYYTQLQKLRSAEKAKKFNRHNGF